MLDAALRVADKSSAAAAERACQLELLSGELHLQEAEVTGLEASLQAARWGWQSTEAKLKTAYSRLGAEGNALASAPKAASLTVPKAAEARGLSEQSESALVEYISLLK